MCGSLDRGEAALLSGRIAELALPPILPILLVMRGLDPRICGAAGSSPAVTEERRYVSSEYASHSSRAAEQGGDDAGGDEDAEDRNPQQHQPDENEEPDRGQCAQAEQAEDEGEGAGACDKDAVPVHPDGTAVAPARFCVWAGRDDPGLGMRPPRPARVVIGTIYHLVNLCPARPRYKAARKPDVLALAQPVG